MLFRHYEAFVLDGKNRKFFYKLSTEKALSRSKVHPGPPRGFIFSVLTNKKNEDQSTLPDKVTFRRDKTLTFCYTKIHRFATESDCFFSTEKYQVFFEFAIFLSGQSEKFVIISISYVNY